MSSTSPEKGSLAAAIDAKQLGRNFSSLRAGTTMENLGIAGLWAGSHRTSHIMMAEDRLIEGLAPRPAPASGPFSRSAMTAAIGTDIDRASSLITGGGLVAFATETVYGLGANAYDVRAVARIFEVKDRPQFDPLIVHVGAPAWVQKVASTVTPLAQRLIDAFWSGPLTLVMP